MVSAKWPSGQYVFGSSIIQDLGDLLHYSTGDASQTAFIATELYCVVIALSMLFSHVFTAPGHSGHHAAER
jgi:hypothetical protein